VNEREHEPCVPLKDHVDAILAEHEKRWTDFHDRIERLENGGYVGRGELLTVVALAMTVVGLIIEVFRK
jgi:hypothetical protein